MCSLIDILQWKKNQKDSDDFWHRKLTLKVKFWYFLTAPHYSNFQNLVISLKYSWFLAKNLSYFVSLPWKLHNREWHNINAPLASLHSNGLKYCYRIIKKKFSHRAWISVTVWQIKETMILFIRKMSEP